MRLFTAVCAVALLSAATLPAFADPSDYEHRSQRVYLGDLDTSNEHDADIAPNRIQRAADNVCDDRMPQPPTVIRNEQACEFEATDEAVHDTGSPTLIARHQGLDLRVVVSDGDSGDYYDPKK